MVTKWSGSIDIGITSLSPETMTFPSTMTDILDGSTHMWSGSSINNIQLDRDLDDCTVGDTIGIMLSDTDTLVFYYNGDKLSVSINLKDLHVRNTDHLYGVVDIYGRCREVSICERGFTEKRPSIGDFELMTQPGSITENRDDIMQQTRMILLVLKEIAVIDIYGACHLVQKFLLLPTIVLNDQLKHIFGDHLASHGTAEVFKYMLDELQNREQTQTDWDATRVIHVACGYYSDASMKFCRHIGQSGILKDMLDDLQRYQTSYMDHENFHTLIASEIIVLHNCSKAADNKHIYDEQDTVNRIIPFTTAEDVNLAATALLTLSYIVQPGDLSYLDASQSVVCFLLQRLQNSLDDPRLRSDGFTTLELVVGLGNLAQHDNNKISITTKGAVPLLLNIMERELPLEQECAINTLGTLSKLESNRKNILKAPGVIPQLSKLTEHHNAAINAAANRALLLLTKATSTEVKKPVNSSPHGCDYRALCKRFKESIGLSDAYFEEAYNMCYCNNCHIVRGDELYYLRGEPPKYYGLPIGWCRFALKVPARASALQVFDNWHVAFHGTVLGAVAPILECGDLCLPGDEVMGGKKLGEREGHFNEDFKPEYFDTKQVFLSPSIRYAGCGAYAGPSQFKDSVTRKTYEARVAFQVCINPDSYKVHPQTIGAESEIDSKFNNQELEWFTKQRGCLIIYGLLVNLQ